MDKTGYSALDNTKLNIIFDLIEHIECHNVTTAYHVQVILPALLTLQQVHDEQTGVSTMLKLVSRTND